MGVKRKLSNWVAPTEQKAKELALLERCKEAEAKKKLVSVRIDKNTIRLMSPEKAEKFFKSKEL